MAKAVIYSGQKVHYTEFDGSYQNGIVKGVAADGKHAWVVYKCGGDWENYKNYTGVRTAINELRGGWRHD